HLSAEDRAFVMMQLDQGASYASIARRLGRARSTIAREVARNVRPLEATDLPAEPASAASVHRYQASAAGHAYRIRRQQSVRQRRLIEGQPLYWRVYDDLVNRRWSPQQIAARLRLMNPDDPTQHVSHETIYASIYAFPRGALKKGMGEALRQSKPQRGRRRRSLSKGHTVPEALHIVNRPEEIEHRLVPGHWEGDFIKGAFNRSAVGTLVERRTRFVVLCRMSGCTAEDALEGFSRQMK